MQEFREKFLSKVFENFYPLYIMPRMRFQTPLVPARLVRRYKRFLADMQLEDGTCVVAHCPNPGSMAGLADPGLRCWLEPNDDPAKKLKFGWRLAELHDGAFVGVDTGAANRIIGAALKSKAVPVLADYGTLRAEVKYGQSSRVDFLLTEPGLPDAYVEVKSVTLCRSDGLAEFPDSVSSRGARHLDELARMAARGHRAVTLYLVQRSDCTGFRLANDIDAAYADAFARATAAGVSTLCYACAINPLGIELSAPVAIKI